MDTQGKIITKKPQVKETVGDQYYVRNNPQGTDFDISKYAENITRTSTVKKIGVSETVESTAVRGSGKVYKTVTKTAYIDFAVENIAVVPEDLSWMKGETSDECGLVQAGEKDTRPFFAYGKVVEKTEEAKQYEWYPKCQLIENTDDIETSGENFAEQNDTLTIRAYPFDDEGHIKNYVNSEMSNFPTGLTEEMFFSSVITSKEDLKAIIASIETEEPAGV